jgi:hypothetical protein
MGFKTMGFAQRSAALSAHGDERSPQQKPALDEGKFVGYICICVYIYNDDYHLLIMIV